MPSCLYYHLVPIAGQYTGKNKAKTAVSVAVEAKPEAEILWVATQKIERALVTSCRPSIVIFALS